MIERNIEYIAQQRIGETPVLLLQGARSVGKSTMLKKLSSRNNAEIIDFDDGNIIALFDNLGSRILPSSKPVFIDEYQKAPAILGAIKHRLNSSSEFGQFVISGSTSFDALPTGTQSLTGRIDRLNILPFSQAEITDNSTYNFMHQLMTNTSETLAALSDIKSTTSREEYLNKIAIGGFPLSLQQANSDARYRWFENYIEYTILHDIPEIMKIRQEVEMHQLVTRLTRSTASVLNVARVSEDIGMNEKTVKMYISLLEKIFLTSKLPTSTVVATKRLVKHSKLHFVDSGIAAHLLDLGEESITSINSNTAANIGHLVETFVVNEVVKLCSILPSVKKIGYWRTRDGEEIDLIVELKGGKVIAIEVKSGVIPSRSDFKHIQKYQQLAGEQFVCGIVFYMGEYAVQYSDELITLPIDVLWKHS
jgi:predicted AAA+ superfamily ATPase